MRLPKSWKGFGDSTLFNATVNGQPLAGRSVAIDPFSFPNAMVVHYLINKNDVIKLAQEQQQPTTATTKQQAANNNNNNNGGVMRFILLTPSTSAQQQQIATSSDLVTNTVVFMRQYLGLQIHLSQTHNLL
jgi:hypothetical protein